MENIEIFTGSGMFIMMSTWRWRTKFSGREDYNVVNFKIEDHRNGSWRRIRCYFQRNTLIKDGEAFSGHAMAQLTSSFSGFNFPVTLQKELSTWGAKKIN